MSKEADLCSAALVKLGAAPIASLDDGTTESLIAARLYPIARDALLSCHPWDFTIAEARLALDPSQSPENGYAFILPSDLLRTISAGAGSYGRGLVYRILGNRLRAESDTVTLTYQRRPDVAEYPAHFVSALVARVAAELALPITENASRADILQKLATAELRLARLVDSQQSTPPAIDDFTLINVRS